MKSHNEMIESLASAMRKKGWKALAVQLPDGTLNLALEESDTLPEIQLDGTDYTVGRRITRYPSRMADHLTAALASEGFYPTAPASR